MPDKPEENRGETAPGTDKALAERTWGPLWNLRDSIDEMLEDLHSGSLFDPLRRRGKGRGGLARGALPELALKMPALDVVEKEDELKLSAELPGLSEDEIDLRVSGSTLTLRGEKREDREEGDEDSDYYLSERRFGAFERAIRIPEGIDRDRIDASFKNGVLTVRLPKKPEARNPSKKIEVKTAS